MFKTLVGTPRMADIAVRRRFGGRMTFEGHRVLVTGAAGGVGRATTDAFRRQGASVCVADLDCSGLDAEAAVPGDLTDMAYADGLAGAAAAALGGLDIVVNNAGFMTRGAVTTTSDDDLARALAVNVEAPLRISWWRCRSWRRQAAGPSSTSSPAGGFARPGACRRPG